MLWGALVAATLFIVIGTVFGIVSLPVLFVCCLVVVGCAILLGVCTPSSSHDNPSVPVALTQEAAVFGRAPSEKTLKNRVDDAFDVIKEWKQESKTKKELAHTYRLGQDLAIYGNCRPHRPFLATSLRLRPSQYMIPISTPSNCAVTWEKNISDHDET